MAQGEKDRFGDKLRDAEKAREDQYFAEKDRQLMEQMRRGKEEQIEEKERQEAHMRCPKCGEKLVQQEMRGANVEECPACRGLWLDKGELEQIAKGEQEGWITRWLRREFEK